MQKRIDSFDGTSINYDIHRIRNSKEFLIFIHGVGGDLTRWKKIRSFFHKLKISTLAIDLRGHGKSDKPKFLEDYKLKKFAQDIREIIKKERIKNPILVGHSLGGMITLTFQDLYPELAKKYIIIGSCYKTPRKLKKIFKKIEYPITLLNKKFRTTFPKRRKTYNSNKKILKKLEKNNILRIIIDVLKTSFKSWLFTLENINHFEGENILKTITKPVLILSGGKDSIINVKNSRRLHELIKGSKLKIFPKGEHILPLTNPKEVSDEIYNFIEDTILTK